MRSYETFYSFSDSLPRSAELGQGEVHVVRLNVEDLRPFLRELYGILTPEERDRASLYRYPRDGDQFILVRGGLRLMLSRYLGIHPQEIGLDYHAKGKPSVSPGNGTATIEFNVSFSGSIAVYAFARGIRLGIDVEQRDPELDFVRVKDRFLENADSQFLDSLPELVRRDSFFALWTLKEAAAKADGEGIFLRATQKKLSLDGWTAFTLFPGAGYSATLVMASPGDRVSFWNWSNESMGLSHGPD